MKTIRTARLKLLTADPRFDAVSAAYLRAANWLSPIIFERGKPENANKLQREFYGTVREKFELPSQIVCSLFRHVVATYRTAKSNGKWRLAVFKNPAVPIVWKRDFSPTKVGVRFWGKTIEWSGPSIPAGEWADSKLKKIKGVWYLILAIKINIPESKTTGSVVGVDSGIKNIFVAVDQTSGKTLYIKGGQLNHRRRCIRRVRSQVSSVGTPSAKQLLKRLSGRENAVTRQLLHVASKRLATWADGVGARVIVMEDLNGVRKGSLKKGKQFRAAVHRWPYAQAQFCVGYKAAAKGIALELVDPYKTSQACPRCGHTERTNRHGLLFQCVVCGFQDHADRVGGTNAALRYVLLRQAEEERAVVNRLIVASSVQGHPQLQAHRL